MTIEEYNKLRQSPDWRWEVFVPNATCPVLDRIHPLQQASVEKIYVSATQWEVECKIIIFGSSVRHDCYPRSDVDMYMEGELGEFGLVMSEFCDACPQGLDIVNPKFICLDDFFMEQVNKGVVIYDNLNQE